MKPNTIHVLTLALIVTLTATLRADEIKLKSGEVLSDVEVIKDDGTKLKLRLPNGRSMTVKKADVVEHVKKETSAQAFKKRAKGLGKKDVDGMLELARWGMDAGAKRDAIKLLNKVIKQDKENEEARDLLGHKKIDGKWLYGRKLEKHLEKAEAAEMKAKGFVKVGGKWVDAFGAKAAKAGLTERDGRWWSKDEIARLDKGELWVEGTWYPADAKTKLDAGMRLDRGKWDTIENLNPKHKSLQSPWVLESEHFRMSAPISHRAIVAALAEVESNWEAMKSFYGDAPLIGGKAKKIGFTLCRGNEAFQARYPGGSKRGGEYGTYVGVMYNPNQDMVYSYYHDERYLLQWSKHGAALAFLDLVHGNLSKLASPMVEALGSYFEGHCNGKYHPQWTVHYHFKEHQFDHPARELARFSVADKEKGFAQIGFVMHFLISKYPDAVKRWKPKFMKGKGQKELMKEVEKDAGGADLRAELRAFHKTFASRWTDPKKGG